jgi:glycosyltransferase involved in cell wall biosynthesis
MVPISLLLPVYNGSLYLEDQIASVLAQTYADFELLIRDDCSTDTSPDIVAEFARSDPRVRWTRNEKNLGQKQTLERLFREAAGLRIMFCDQDDVWDAHKIERLDEAFDGVSLTYGDSLLIDASGRSLGKSIFDYVLAPLEGRNAAALLVFNTVSGHALMVDKSVIDPTVFSSTMPYDQAVALHAALAKGLRYVPQAITLHRQHEANQHNHFLRGIQLQPWRMGLGAELAAFAEPFRVAAQAPAAAPAHRAAWRTLVDAAQASPTRWFGLYIRDKRFLRAAQAAIDLVPGEDSRRVSIAQRSRKISQGYLHPSRLRQSLRALSAPA